jgi:creatinine deaminase
LQDRGVKVEVVNSDECKRLMDEFIAANPTLWNEDIGVTNG